MSWPQSSRPNSGRGLFLTLDGPDGGGKTTQAAKLAAWLSARGYDVVTCRDPGGTPLGDRLRQILLDRDTVDLSLRAEMLLYMASRAQLVEDVVRPALAAGRTVVSDRYLLANLVYQGYASGLPIEQVSQVGLAATGALLPDLTVVLDVPLDLARQRLGAVRDRIEDRPLSYHARVREGFLDAARRATEESWACYPAPIVVVDGSAPPDVVATRIQSEVEHVLALGPRS